MFEVQLVSLLASPFIKYTKFCKEMPCFVVDRQQTHISTLPALIAVLERVMTFSTSSH